MEEGTNEEVRLTVKNEKNTSNINTNTYLLHLLSPFTWAWIIIVLAIYIYDSLLGYALKISYLSKKTIDACVSSKMCLACNKAQQIDEEPSGHI